MASRRHFHTPSSKHFKPKLKNDPAGFVIAVLEQAIGEVRIGNFVRARGLIASQTGLLAELARASNQQISPSDRPLKQPRQRNGCAREGRSAPMRVSLSELLGHPNNVLLSAADAAPAGRWPPGSARSYAGEDDDMGGTKPSDPDGGVGDEE